MINNNKSINFLSKLGLGSISKALVLLICLAYGPKLAAQSVDGRLMSFDFSAATTNIVTYPTYFGNTTYVDTAGVTITQGAGINPGAAQTNGAMTFQGINAGSESAAVTNGDYLEFQYRPKAGFEGRLDSLIYRWQFQNASVVISTSVRTSLDNYTSVVGTVAPTSSATAFGNNVSKIVFTRPIYARSTVTIRLYFWGAAVQNRDIRLTDGTVNNTFNHDLSLWGRASAIKTLLQSFDFSTSTGTEASRPTYTCANTFIDTSGVTITRGAGLSAPTAQAGSYGAVGFNVSGTEATAVSGNDFFQFSLKPQIGYEYDLDRIMIRYNSTLTTGPTAYALRTSRDNYATNIASGTLLNTGQNTTYTEIRPTAAFNTDSAITFRLYIWGATSLTSAFRFTDSTQNNTFNHDIAFYGDATTATIPTAVLSNGLSGSTICLGGGAYVKVAIAGGTPPFTVWTTDNLGLKRSFTQNGVADSFLVFPQTTKTYTLDSVKDAMLHSAVSMSGSATVTVTNSPVVTGSGTYTRTLSHNDGLTLTYADGTLCKSWLTISDSIGGTTPGSTTCIAQVLDTLPSNNTARRFLPRRLSITPTTNGVANVTLFYTQAEFDAFNSAITYQVKFPINSTDTVGVKSKLLVRRTTSSIETDGLTTFTPSSVVWNATNAQWEITFRVNDGILSGNYYVSTPFTSTKMVTGITHVATTPIVGNTVASVTVDWADVVGVTQYRIRIRPQGGAWNTSTVTGSQRLYSTLAFNTTYEVQLRVYESATVQGEYSATYTFTTPTDPGRLQTCNPPANVTATVNNAYTTTINWSASNQAASYMVELRPKNTLVWGGTTTTGTSMVFNTLTPSTTYEYRVRSSCTPGTTENPTSQFTTIDTFRLSTLAPCGTVQNIVTPTVSATSIVLQWPPVSFATSYQVQMRVKNAATWGGTTVAGTTCTFNNLSSSTTYEYRVRAYCNNTPALTTTGTGVFSATGEVTTSFAPLIGTCLPPTNVVVTPSTNSLTVTWDSALNADRYFLNIKPVGGTTWGGTMVYGLSYTFANLSPASNYHIRIRTTCLPGSTLNVNSAFTDTILASTNPLPNSFVSGNVDVPVTLYPNPTRDILQVGYSSKTENPVHVYVYDVTGRVVYTRVISPLMGENNIELNLSSLQDGMYLLRLQQDGQWRYTGQFNKIGH